jgi:hypothetical protein
MVYRFCVASEGYDVDVDAYDDAERGLAYAARMLARDPDAAALLVNGELPAMMDAWYARQSVYPPARDQLLRDLAERAPAIAESLRLALRAPDAQSRVLAAQRLLAQIRGSAVVAAR